MTRSIVDGLGQIISGRVSAPKTLGGPIKIAQVAGQQAALGRVAVRRAARAVLN